MLIINNRFIPFGRKHLAINLLGVIFTKGPLSPSLINHELIHTRQQIELLFIFFYILYVMEWLFRLIEYRNFYAAYINISFEREAYDNMYEPIYLKNRKHYSWLRYLKRRVKS